MTGCSFLAPPGWPRTGSRAPPHERDGYRSAVQRVVEHVFVHRLARGAARGRGLPDEAPQVDGLPAVFADSVGAIGQTPLRCLDLLQLIGIAPRFRLLHRREQSFGDFVLGIDDIVLALQVPLPGATQGYEILQQRQPSPRKPIAQDLLDERARAVGGRF